MGRGQTQAAELSGSVEDHRPAQIREEAREGCREWVGKCKLERVDWGQCAAS